MANSKTWFWTIVKILVTCLVVGWIFTLFDYQALDIVRGVSNFIHNLSDRLLAVLRWALPTILLGAIVVMPVVLIRYGVRMLRKRKD